MTQFAALAGKIPRSESTGSSVQYSGKVESSLVTAPAVIARKNTSAPKIYGVVLVKSQVTPSAVQPRLLTVKQSAEYLACSTHAIRQLQWSRAIPSLKIGKLIQFDRADLDRYVDAQKA
jgi:excisionase family DNA binding protein